MYKGQITSVLWIFDTVEKGKHIEWNSAYGDVGVSDNVWDENVD